MSNSASASPDRELPLLCLQWNGVRSRPWVNVCVESDPLQLSRIILACAGQTLPHTSLFTFKEVCAKAASLRHGRDAERVWAHNTK